MSENVPRMMLSIRDPQIDGSFAWREYIVAPASKNLDKEAQIEWLKEKVGIGGWAQDGEAWVKKNPHGDWLLYRIDVSITDQHNMEKYGRYNYGGMIIDAAQPAPDAPGEG